MGLTSLLLGDQNPFSKYVADNRNTIRGAFAGFGQGRNFSEGLGRAALGANQGAQSDDAYAITQAAEAKRQEQLMAAVENMRRVNPKIADLVAGAGPEAIESGWNAIMKSMSGANEPLEINGQLIDPTTFEVLGDYRNPDQMQPGGDTSYGVTPIWGQRPDGTFGYGVQGDDGSFKPVDTGELTPLDPRTLKAEQAAGTAFGRGQGNAVFDLPQAQWTASETTKEIDALMSHPGLEEMFGSTLGIPNVMTPTWPGSPKADFQARLNQESGRVFLQAYEMLRGGGQITEVEGQKAEQAMARLSTAQSKPEFLRALTDLKLAVQAGLEKLQQQATMPPVAPVAPGASDLRSKYGLE